MADKSSGCKTENVKDKSVNLTNLTLQEVLDAKRELAETKTILVSHQNDSIRRMQESRRMKSIILTLWAPRGPYMDPQRDYVIKRKWLPCFL